MKNDNRDAVLNAIWNNPERLFGGEWRNNGQTWEYVRGGQWNQRGALRLLRAADGVRIKVALNRGSGNAGARPIDIFDYGEQYLNTGEFNETLEAWANLYNLNLEFTADERQKMARAELARELAPSFVEALKQHPDGETARYLKETRRLTPDTHFGELTADTLKRAVAHLKNRGIAYDPDDLTALGLTEYRAEQGYNCVIPYTVNGRVVGFSFRNIRPNHDGPKYMYNKGLTIGGYCGPLENGKPAVVVEGLLDAVRLVQLGVKNVVSMGGSQMPEQMARLLRGHGIVEVFYIPDHETDLNQQRETKLVADAIHAFQSVRVDDTPVVERLYIVDLPAPDDWTRYPKYKNGALVGYKIDADTYGAEHPDDLRGAIEYGAVVSWEWELEQLMAWAVAQDNATGFVGYNEFQKRFNDIYTRCGSPYERQRIRQYIATGNVATIYKEFGITPQSCEHADAWKRADEYTERVRTATADLNRAVAEQADPETVGAIVQRLNDAQAANTRDEWAAQLGETFEDELAAIQEQPDTLKTRWEVGNIDKMGQYKKYERVEFTPADISLFCAQTSHGKTMVLFQLAFDLIRDTDKTFLFVSCEENKRQLVERALNVFIDIPATPTGEYKDADGYKRPCFIEGIRKKTIKAIIRGTVPPDEYQPDESQNAVGNAQKRNVYDELAADVRREIKRYGEQVRPRLKFIHTAASVESICNNVVRFVEEYRNNGVEVGGVFVDYMQLLTSDARNFSRHDELKDICNALRDCAELIELPIIIAAQLNRDVLRPVSGYGTGFDTITEANIGEGADIERAAHDIYLVWQVDKTPLAQYYKGVGDNGEPQLNTQKIGFRSRRLFAPDVYGNPSDLKLGYMYIEQLKARDGRPNGWGLFPFDGERGRIGTIDKAKMKEQ